MVDKVIRTENAAKFIGDYVKLDNRCAGPQGIDERHIPEVLKDEIIISESSGLIIGATLTIEVELWLSNRCNTKQTFVYRIEHYDSVSVKGTLEKYYVTPIYNDNLKH